MIFRPTTISNATINSNSARQSGGGIWNDPLDGSNNPLTNTFTNLVMKGNTADSNNALATGESTRGDGGAIYHNRGVLNLTGLTVGGTAAGEPNTAYNGGGIGHSYAQNAGAPFNAATLNINGGSIVGNVANNDGGGVLNDATRTAGANPTVLNIGVTTAVTLTDNKARNNGGGIAVITGAGSTSPTASATLNNMNLLRNQANSDSSGGGDGGAFYQNNNAATVGTTFTGTLAIGSVGNGNSGVNGGGISNNAGLIVLPSNANIVGNSATGNGGGINNGGTINSFTGATISNNSATTSGGGIFNSGTITVDGATLNSNSAATGSSVTQSAGTFNSTGTNTFNGNLAISGGTFNAGASTVNLGGNFSFTPGTFTQGTSTFNFNGAAAQTISGTVTFNNLTVNNGNGVTLNNSETVGGTLTLTNGTLAVGTNTLTLNSTVTVTGGNLSSAATGTVNYNQASNGQNVAPGNYGNLTFSNFNKTLPASTVGIAGTFTPGTGTATTTGNTISFNGAGAQTIPVFNYNNLTIATGGIKSLGGNVTVPGTLDLQAGTLAVGTNILTLNGAATSSGGTFSSVATGTVNYNQSSNGQNVLAGNYGNLTFSNFNKTLASSGTIGIAGTFTPGTGTPTTTGSTLDFNGAGAQTVPAFSYNNLTISQARGGATVTLVNGTINVAGTFSPTATGVVYSTTGNTFVFNGAGAQTIPAFTFNNLSTATGGTKTLGGNVSAAGALTIATGTTLDASASNFTLNVGGNWANNGTFTPQGGTVVFNGTAAQSLGGSSATTFNNFTLNNSAGLNLTLDSTVNGALTMTIGVLNTGTNVLIVGAAGTSARTAGMVIGDLEKIYNSNSTFNYPVGTATGYSPVSFTTTNLATNPSRLKIKANDGTAPATPALVNATTLNRFWTLTETGDLTGNVIFNYLQADVRGNENNYRTIRVSGTTASSLPNGTPCPGAANVCVDPGANTITVRGLGAFSNWTAGELAPTAAAAMLDGRLTDENSRGLSKVLVMLVGDNGTPQYALSDWLGNYHFGDVPVGVTYVVTPVSNRYQFKPASRVLSVVDNAAGIDFVGGRQSP